MIKRQPTTVAQFDLDMVCYFYPLSIVADINNFCIALKEEKGYSNYSIISYRRNLYNLIGIHSHLKFKEAQDQLALDKFVAKHQFDGVGGNSEFASLMGMSDLITTAPVSGSKNGKQIRGDFSPSASDASNTNWSNTNWGNTISELANPSATDFRGIGAAVSTLEAVTAESTSDKSASQESFSSKTTGKSSKRKGALAFLLEDDESSFSLDKLLHDDEVAIQPTTTKEAKYADLAYVKLPNFTWDELQLSDFTAVIQQLYLIGLSVNAQNQFIASLRSFFLWLQEKGKVKINPTKLIKTVRGNQEYKIPVDPTEIDHLLNQMDLDTFASIRDYLIFTLMSTMGLRVSEVVSLNLQDINLENNTITVYGKGKSIRHVPISTTVKHILNTYLVVRLQYIVRYLEESHYISGRNQAKNSIAVSNAIENSSVSNQVDAIASNFANQTANQVASQTAPHTDALPSVEATTRNNAKRKGRIPFYQGREQELLNDPLLGFEDAFAVSLDDDVSIEAKGTEIINLAKRYSDLMAMTLHSEKLRNGKTSYAGAIASLEAELADEKSNSAIMLKRAKLPLGDVAMEQFLAQSLDQAEREQALNFSNQSDYHLVHQALQRTRHDMPIHPLHALFLSNRMQRVTVRLVQAKLSKHALKAGNLHKIHPHRLRHAFAVRMYESTQNIRAVQMLLGHKTADTTNIYTNLDIKFIKEVFDRTHPDQVAFNKLQEQLEAQEQVLGQNQGQNQGQDQDQFLEQDQDSLYVNGGIGADSRVQGSDVDKVLGRVAVPENAMLDLTTASRALLPKELAEINHAGTVSLCGSRLNSQSSSRITSPIRSQVNSDQINPQSNSLQANPQHFLRSHSDTTLLQSKHQDDNLTKASTPSTTKPSNTKRKRKSRSKYCTGEMLANDQLSQADLQQHEEFDLEAMLATIALNNARDK